MDKGIKKIAIVCDYKLLPERVGGMDYFFWLFDQKCKDNLIDIDWFFPNNATHGGYAHCTIYSSNGTNVEQFFNQYCLNQNPTYSHIITHFIELSLPVFKKIKATQIKTSSINFPTYQPLFVTRRVLLVLN